MHRLDANGKPLSGFGEFGLPLPDPDPDPCTANGPWTFGAGRLAAATGGGAILVAGAHGPGRLVSGRPTVEEDRDTVGPQQRLMRTRIVTYFLNPSLPWQAYVLGVTTATDLLRAAVIEQE